jgi:hypothetical protein
MVHSSDLFGQKFTRKVYRGRRQLRTQLGTQSETAIARFESTIESATKPEREKDISPESPRRKPTIPTVSLRTKYPQQEPEMAEDESILSNLPKLAPYRPVSASESIKLSPPEPMPKRPRNRTHSARRLPGIPAIGAYRTRAGATAERVLRLNAKAKEQNSICMDDIASKQRNKMHEAQVM